MRGDDRFDGFDWASWGEGDQADMPGADGTAAPSANGHHAAPGGDGNGTGEDTDEAQAAGWVAAGGVLHWEEPDETATDPRAEMDSPLAADDLDLPEGAPDAPRVRAAHAWMLRQRARQQDALGALLLARREQRTDADEPPARRPRRAEAQAAPLDLAIAEHEAAIGEYDTLLAALEDHAAHAGPGRTLVEYYLWLTEHLAGLAAAPEAATGDAPPATLAAARWRGAALAALAARGRVERVSAPSAEED